MRWFEGQKGYTLVEMVVVMTLLAVALGGSAPLSRRVISRYELNTAAQTLLADVARAKIRAIQTNAVTTVKLESNQYYRAADTPRQLPGLVKFADGSPDSVAFNGLGAVTAGAMVSFVLVEPYGGRREIRIYAAGGQEVLKL